MSSSLTCAPLMLGLSGPTLTPAELEFIKNKKPFSFIIFARNIEAESQVRNLTAQLADLSPLLPLIAVDQEGGRVQRLSFGGRLPPVRVYGRWHEVNPEAALNAIRLHATLLAAQGRQAGATWLLGPVLDLALPATHAIIGDRALAADPAIVTTLGQAFLQGVRAGGCLGCLKHAPGHGRAVADSHLELPEVAASAAELTADTAPFRALAQQAEFLMTAHIRYPAWDATHPATTSPEILHLMRAGWHFPGLIMADDLGMKALQGSYAGRARAALAAGCDGVIAALSVLKHGMAGTVWDEDNFKALQQADLPPLNPRATAYLQNLALPPALTPAELAEKTAEYRALWATRPAGLDATVSV